MLSFSFCYLMRGLFAAKDVDKIEFYVDKIEELLYIHFLSIKHLLPSDDPL